MYNNKMTAVHISMNLNTSGLSRRNPTDESMK